MKKRPDGRFFYDSVSAKSLRVPLSGRRTCTRSARLINAGSAEDTAGVSRSPRLIKVSVMTARCRILIRWLAMLLCCGSSVLHASTLVLVSIDGFRWDYLDRPEASQMKALAERGVRVTKLRTVYPSKTFPAHMSIATGLRPAQHGIVDNYFCRTDRPDCYTMGSGKKDPTWLAGTPIWTLVEQQGGRASTFFWPESDAAFSGVLPTDYRAYDGRTPHAERVEQAISWLALPAPERPKLVTLYFSSVDSAGHTYGPDAPETLAAIADVDSWIANLWQAIEALNARENAGINLVLVSDHGMAAVDPDQFIDTNTLPRPGSFKRVNASTRVMYYPQEPDANQDALVEKLAAQSEGRYWQVSPETLAERSYVDHPAVAAIVIETDPPRMFRRGGGEGADLRGMHGYPASIDDMAAFLVAIGPDFRVGRVIPEAHQLDVYPVAASLLGLSVPEGLPSDGAALRQALSAERE